MSKDTKDPSDVNTPEAGDGRSIRKPVREKDVRVLIVAHKPKGLQSTHVFLQRRGWPTKIVTSTKEAFAVIQTEAPTHILLSWNLSGSNTPRTEQLITNTFQLPVIVFAEKSDAAQMAKMAKAGIKHIMLGPVSGPGVQMKIRRMIREEEDERDGKSGRKKKNRRAAADDAGAVNEDWKTVTSEHSNETENSTVIEVQAEDIPSKGEWRRVERSDAGGRARWVFKAETDEAGESGETDENQGAFYYDGDKPPVLKEDGSWGLAESEGSLNFSTEGANFTAMPRPKSEKKAWYESIDQESGWTREKKDGYTLETGNAKNDTYEFEVEIKGRKGKLYEIESEGARDPEHGFESAPEEMESSGTSSTSAAQPVDELERQLIPIRVPILKVARNLDSLLAQSAQKALAEALNPENEMRQAVGLTQNIGIIPVATERFRGFLLCALGGNEHCGQDLLQKIRESLKAQLSLVGEKMRTSDQFQIEIEAMDIVPWTEEFCDFSIRAQHGQREVAVAFLPMDDIEARAHESQEPEYFAIDSLEIKAEIAVTFDLYLRLPVNRRYIRYLQRGQFITLGQIEKFRKFEVKQFHVKRSDLESFKAYRANLLLNETIQSTRVKKSA